MHIDIATIVIVALGGVYVAWQAKRNNERIWISMSVWAALSIVIWLILRSTS